ncbi:small hydrophobic protein [Streptomyces jietaisiensis]|uniref:small hydrophobic protein n=1 Tax=Streptomyces griseoaurantiacus TaxID=68213 RepID=UPI0032514425
MAGFGNGSRAHPRSRGRMGSRWGFPLFERSRELGGGPDRATLGIVGLVCAIAGFFVLGIVLGPVAVICGWLGMGRSWAGSRPVPALVALVLGAIDTLLALVWVAGAAGPGGGLF